MQYFRHLEPSVHRTLFHRSPETVDTDGDLATLAVGLGATLYVPAVREGLVDTVRKRAHSGVESMVIDLEDAVADDDLDAARTRVVAALDELARYGDLDILLFVRIRTVLDIHIVCEGITDGIAVLAGFVVPKFRSDNGGDVLTTVDELSARLGKRLLVMPVLESVEILFRETRDAELSAIHRILDEHRDRVLAVRIGATDMCGAFGIRRDRDLTIYDVRVVADTIGAIVNYLGRTDGSGFVITGPVWEYFADHERMFRPMLRATPFENNDAVTFRQKLVSRDLDGLLREVALDRANGLQGKTVIHPSHVPPVHALSVVTHEEYQDALSIIESGGGGGVLASGYRNKMNELKPHRSWAEQTLVRASVFGVTNEGTTFVDVMQALAKRRAA
ncbi:ATP/GTP-binding protein [Rhodococcoides trifolii]|uniref:ATP/GTP-binding protein n=1 Tax=Rhodococcoides trifolii TaxID=908250 RepID=A0A917CN13_9NOCA|nr:HpcH/HpaI aldolase/citrate lyase family protein [Rhodococcus trifolii]GGF91769.1 ATP/GTP-binding protein [Rhodococcus trifolii]